MGWEQCNLFEEAPLIPSDIRWVKGGGKSPLPLCGLRYTQSPLVYIKAVIAIHKVTKTDVLLLGERGRIRYLQL